MSAKPFLDSNILIYAFAAHDPRSEVSEALIAQGGIVSVQVLNEFVNVSRNKLHKPWTEIERALQVLETLLDPPLALTFELHRHAIKLARRYTLSFYDSLIIAAASLAKCSTLFSEDMQDGQVISGVTICNPFAI